MTKETAKEFADRQNAIHKAKIKKMEEDQARKVNEDREAKSHV